MGIFLNIIHVFKKGKFSAIFCILALLAGYSAHIISFDRAPELDWNYFASLSLVVRSIVLNGHEFPLRDPWVNGGLDLLANPQNRIFSPNVFFDIVLSPYWANIFSLIVGGLFGILGMFRLARILGAEPITAYLCAIIFVNSSWFGNHFAEGHIPFNSFQQIPWLLYLIFKPHDRRTIPLIFLLFSIWILDGGMYAFIFSIPLIMVMTAAGLINIRSLLTSAGSFSKSMAVLGLSVFSFMLSVSPKMTPLLGLLASRRPQQEFTIMSVTDVLASFFAPLQSPLKQLSTGLPWRMHEYGCYIGSLAVVLTWGLLWKACDKRVFKFLSVAIFFAWVGSGWGEHINPWQIFMRIPLINNAHVQSRLFIFTYIFLILCVIEPLNNLLQKNRHAFTILFLFMIVEFTAVKAYPTYAVFSGASRPTPHVNLIPYDGIMTTIRSAKKPDHYFDGRKSAVITYEPAAIPTGVIPNDSKFYRGEAWVSAGSGSVSIIRHTPSLINLSYNLQADSVITFNTNFLLGWDASHEFIETRPNNLGLLTAAIPAGSGILELHYSPWYFQPVLLSFAIGVLFWTWLILFRDRKITKGAYDYSKIPVHYYDQVFYAGPSVQRAWHVQKFDRVRDYLPKKQGQSILDIGCFSGTFLSTLDSHVFSTQIGMDILESQIKYAQENYGTNYRDFYLLPDISSLQNSLPASQRKLDCLTSIEVIEHLPEEVIRNLFEQSALILMKGGKFVITTPNYLSAWPLIEILLNYFSPTSYAEQHITKFTWLNLERKLKVIYPDFDKNFTVDLKTTTHFIAPFLAPTSFKYSRLISRSVDHRKWRFPFGNLIMVVLIRK
jgi:2-polyprenyl-3-methyl-5-hydroxy-6-metoxy-1,4-benzoquinol methylase